MVTADRPAGFAEMASFDCGDRRLRLWRPCCMTNQQIGQVVIAKTNPAILFPPRNSARGCKEIGIIGNTVSVAEKSAVQRAGPRTPRPFRTHLNLLPRQSSAPDRDRALGSHRPRAHAKNSFVVFAVKLHARAIFRTPVSADAGEGCRPIWPREQ